MAKTEQKIIFPNSTVGIANDNCEEDGDVTLTVNDQGLFTIKKTLDENGNCIKAEVVMKK